MRNTISAAKRNIKTANRCAKTLIELMVVIAVMSTMLAVAARSMHMLLNVERASTVSVAGTTNFSRLANLFREDVHAGRSVSIVPGQNDQVSTLEIKTSVVQKTVYSIQNNRITREVRESQEVKHSDHFVLPVGKNAFKIDGANVSFVHRRNYSASKPTQASLTTSREIRVAAVVGRDHRFAKVRN